eukprot:6212263-Pleurochrysis_carterae.AAC.7
MCTALNRDANLSFTLARKSYLRAPKVSIMSTPYIKCSRTLCVCCRFTVHYNLCFGTVLAVGGPEQVAMRSSTFPTLPTFDDYDGQSLIPPVVR